MKQSRGYGLSLRPPHPILISLVSSSLSSSESSLIVFLPDYYRNATEGAREGYLVQ
jgi:hypothetical protein